MCAEMFVCVCVCSTKVAMMQWKSIAGLESVKQLVWVAQHLSSTFYCLTSATKIVTKRGNYLHYPAALDEI